MLPSIAFNGFTLTSAFQPIYGVREGRAIGYEGLVRATGPNGDSIRASELFESCDLAELVSLDRTCRTLHLRSFAAVDPGRGMLFLNSDPVAAVADAAVPRHVRSRIASFGLTPDRVCIEILESCCADEGQLTEAVAEMRAMGLAIAMDDFGIARSNFDRVAALRPDYVKLDRSILVDAVGDATARRMLPSMIEILRETGAKVVMEGIEDAAEALLSIESGADLLQGFYFAVPSAKLHDDALTRKILRELARMRNGRRISPIEAVEFPAPEGSLSQLMSSALRDAPPRETPVTEQAR